MAIKSLARSTVRQAQRYNSALAGYESNYFHHLETVRLGGNAASVSFTNLSRYSDFQHLQIRVICRDTRATTGGNNVRVTINGDSSGAYAWHRLRGDGSSVSSAAGSSVTFMNLFASVSLNDAANAFGAAIIDILDPFDTTKNTTLRVLQGYALASNTSAVELRSGFWNNTAAMSSVSFVPDTTGNFAAGTRFSLYGLKAKA
jgi:hypothetical protein